MGVTASYIGALQANRRRHIKNKREIGARCFNRYRFQGGDDGWVEIDLQKDRQLTRIELVLGSTAIWDRFDVQVWNTGQSVAAARSWYREVNGPWKLANLGDDKTLSLYGPVTRARYVRLRVPRSTPEVQLAEIRIFGTN